MTPQLSIPSTCRMLLQRLETHGFDAYLVGGCVRDALLHKTPYDWDLCTAATPDDMASVFSDLPTIDTGKKHGTLTVLVDQVPYEITTFRVDGAYTDGRHPDCVQFTRSITEDLARRDFTINAMAYRPSEGLIDPFGGQTDLKNRVIRCVGDPETRFTEDALRLLRALRFAAVLGFSIDPETLRGLQNRADALSQVAPERIFAELKKTLTAPYAAASLRLCPALLFRAVPELSVLENVPQNTPHHAFDVWEHTLHTLDFAPPDTITRLAALFHDTGKQAAHTEKAGIDHFYGHAGHSVQITQAALRRLRCDNKTLHAVSTLVQLHDVVLPMRPVKLRRLLSEIGYETFYRLMDLVQADDLAHRDPPAPRQAQAILDAVQTAKRMEAENFCLHTRQLAINGQDLLQMGCKGPEIGQLLHTLLEEYFANQLPNEHSALLRRAEQWLQKRSKRPKDRTL